jgi:ATP citrate (pro-S)-lyase
VHFQFVTPSVSPSPSRKNTTADGAKGKLVNGAQTMSGIWSLFDRDTKAIVWGQQLKAIQGMLDYDYVCERQRPSVVASTYPLADDYKQKFYFGHKEILVPGRRHFNL